MNIKKISDFLYSLKYIFQPSFWIMNEPYSAELDLLVNRLLDEHEIEIINSCRCKLGEYVFWTENYPYGAFTLYENHNLRPSRATIELFKRELDSARIKRTHSFK